MAVPITASAQPVSPARLNVSTAGVEANGASALLGISADGRTVLFWSSATNLVADDTNGADDLFIRDRDTDRDGVLDEPGAVRTLRIPQGPAGQRSGDVSRDGRFILFGTEAALVGGDTNGVGDGYLYDRDVDGDGIFDEDGAAGLFLVTSASNDVEAVGGASSPRQVSADGRYVLFISAATNLQPRPTTTPQFYRKDRLTSQTVLVSSLPDGTPADRSGIPADRSATAAMSTDGRLVMLAAAFDAMWPGNPPGSPAYPWVLRDLDAGTFTPIPIPATTPPPVPPAFSFPSVEVAGFSPDGQRAYLVETVTRVQSAGRSTFGTTFEYDVPTGRILQRLPGVAVRPLFQDGYTFTLFSFQIFFGPWVDQIARYDRRTGRLSVPVPASSSAYNASASGRLLYSRTGSSTDTPMLLDDRFGVPLPMPSPVPVRPRTDALDASGSTVFFDSDDAAVLPGGADTNGVRDIFAVDLSHLDRDGDGLDDRWEIAMGLDYTSNAGAEGAAGDPDGDGLTNLQEQTAESHPRGAVRTYLAEGADNAFFKTRLALANPGTTATTAVVRFDGDGGTARSINVHVLAGARRTVFMDEVGATSPSFSTVVDATLPLVAERTMSWDAAEYGAHAERASATPATRWFLAEGATGAFSLFYLLQNPGDTAATATIRYLRPSPLPPIDRVYTLPPHSRTTLPVDQQAPELASGDVSASIIATAPILVERAMYRSAPGQPFAAGHASAGVTSDATSWFLAEGATGPFFDLFVLLANFNVTDATVEIRYLVPGGTVLTKTYSVPAESRRTIYVDAEDFPGLGLALANVTVSCAITSTNAVPVVVERSMWFPGPDVTPDFWTEAHNSAGATATARRWVLADGEAGGAKGTQTYVLIANTSSTPGLVRLTALPDLVTTPEGTPAPVVVILDLPPNSRTTVPMHTVTGLAETRFGVLVESIGTTPLADLVVERAMYWNSGGVTWAAGTNLLATPLP